MTDTGTSDADTGAAGQGPTYRSVFVRAGRNGWGRGLELTPTPEKNKVISVTGGGIHAVAARIAELTGAEAVDGFRTRVPDEEVLAAVINCGGTSSGPTAETKMSSVMNCASGPDAPTGVMLIVGTRLRG